MTLGLLLRYLTVKLLLPATTEAGEQAALQRWYVQTKLLGGTALATVQKSVLASVVSRFHSGHGHALDDAVEIIQRLSSSLYE